MCGIAGLLNLDGGAIEHEQPVMQRMVRSLRHRGPDDGAVWGEGPIWLGHRRLAILDLTTAGRQPMSDPTGRFWISYNGEVYNHRQLRHELAQQGATFHSHTDTEVLVQGFARWGKSLFAKLNGMFALALWDRREQVLYLTRDGVGMKPLFFASDGRYLRFGSEIQAILVDERVRRKPNIEGLKEFFALGYCGAPTTGFDGIEQIMPGELATVARGAIWKESWYELPYPSAPPTRSLGDSIALLDHSLDESIRRHQISDVPIAAFLSGGLDSSAIVRSLSKESMNEAIQTCTIQFDDSSFDESPMAKIVADRYRTRHTSTRVAATSIGLLSSVIDHAQEPLADNSAIPTFALSQFAASQRKVALSGDGADELLAGYSTYLADRMVHWYRRLPVVLREGIMAPLVRALPIGDAKYHWAGLARRFVDGARYPFPLSHCHWRAMVPSHLWKRLFQPPLADNQEAPFRRYAQVLQSAPAWLDPLAQQLHLDLRFHLPNDMLVKVDRMSMAHGLEVRVPFLDQEVLRAALSIPSSHKLRRMQGKYVLRRLLDRDLPRTITRRKKAGFVIPIESWMRGEWLPLLKEHLNKERCESTGLLAPDGVQSLIEEHSQRKSDHAYTLFTLLVFSLWWERWMSGNVSAPQDDADEVVPRVVRSRSSDTESV